MVTVIRSEDGESFALDIFQHEIDSQAGLRLAIQRLTSIHQDDIIAFLLNGQPLRDDNVKQLTGDETIFIFNREFLYTDTDLASILPELTIEAPLLPPVEDSLSYSWARVAHHHLQSIAHLVTTLRAQSLSLEVASTNLNIHVSSVASTFDSFLPVATRELDRQSALLKTHALDLEIISKVKVHPDFLSASIRKSVESGGKERTLGDYVSGTKMRVVAESCAKLHEDLLSRFNEAREVVSELTSGSEQVSNAVTSSFFTDAEVHLNHAQTTFDGLSQMTGSISKSEDKVALLAELKRMDGLIRQDLRLATDIKNKSTVHLIENLRHVSQLQSQLVELPSVLTALENELRAKAGFTHMQRLHSMLYMYGATLVEIVRRKEFGRFFSERAQNIAEVMAKFSASERKRRQTYRSDVFGNLPFETKGMDDQPPSLEISTSGTTDSIYTMDRHDVAVFLDAMDQIEKTTEIPTLLTPVSETSEDIPTENSQPPHPVREARVALEKLISRMDGLEVEFDKMAERSIMSMSRLGHSKRRSVDDTPAYREAVEQLRNLQNVKQEEERTFRATQESLEAEVERLRGEAHASSHHRDNADRLEQELEALRTQVHQESAARRSLEQERIELKNDVDKHRNDLDEALREVSHRAKQIDDLKFEVDQLKAEADELRQLQKHSDTKVTNLLDEQAKTLQHLEEARLRGDDLQEQISVARAEGDEANKALKEAGREKERLLKAQASEAERALRDHKAETDGDIAVLDHQLGELRTSLEKTKAELKDALVEVDVGKADISGLREEVQRLEHELKEASKTEDELRISVRDSNRTMSELERKSQQAQRMIVEVLEVAKSLRDANVNIMSSAHQALQSSSKAFSTTRRTLPTNMADSMSVIGRSEIGPPPGPQRSNSLPTSVLQLPPPSPPPPIDTSDPPAALQTLKDFDIPQFTESMHKTVSAIRKWQKQCKEYRERAKAKISFRHFQKGDLALFLPTRNSTAKAWAAFNVSFPNHFLNATGQIAEQLKTREWIVARITAIDERVADNSNPITNPYGLGQGVKYFLLDVEDHGASNPSGRRRVSSPPPARNLSSAARLEEEMSLERVRSWNGTPPSLARPPSPRAGEAQTALSPVSDVFSPSPSQRFFGSPPTSPTTPGPSSLSKLLAQASISDRPHPPPHASSSSAQPQLNPIFEGSPSPSGSPVQRTPLPPFPLASSPLKPPSTKSSSSSRPSSAPSKVPPPFAISSSPSNKAVATIAVSELSSGPIPNPVRFLPSPLSPSPNQNTDNPPTSNESSVPSPEGSASEAMSTMLLNRPRTTSLLSVDQAPASSTTNKAGVGVVAASSAGNALANLATSWSASLLRRSRRPIPTVIAGEGQNGTVSENDTGADQLSRRISGASEILKRYDAEGHRR